jgi:hypothetical protein
VPPETLAQPGALLPEVQVGTIFDPTPGADGGAALWPSGQTVGTKGRNSGYRSRVARSAATSHLRTPPLSA